MRQDKPHEHKEHRNCHHNIHQRFIIPKTKGNRAEEASDCDFDVTMVVVAVILSIGLSLFLAL